MFARFTQAARLLPRLLFCTTMVKGWAFAVMQPATRGQPRCLGLAIFGSVLIKSEPEF